MVTSRLLLAGLLLTSFASAQTVRVIIENGNLTPSRISLKAGQTFLVENHDARSFILEGAGALPGDIEIAARGQASVPTLRQSGHFEAILEEEPTSTLDIDLLPDPSAPTLPREAPFVTARAKNRQPLLSDPGFEPGYASYTAFNLSVKGEDARQQVLQDLFRLQEELAGPKPPADLAPYFPGDKWSQLRSTIAMVFALGPGAYDPVRFGKSIAATRPAELRIPATFSQFKLTETGQRDICVRIVSDAPWFNQLVCHLVWQRLQSRIAKPTFESGYANPGGRSPLLGGFFDGTGNPAGDAREQAVYGDGNGSYMAWFKVRFDVDRFTHRSLAQQQQIIGREKLSGRSLLKPVEDSHKARAEGDGKVAIMRQPFIYDGGPNDTGLLFASVQSSLKPLETILFRYMLDPKKKDHLVQYMTFTQAAYYYIPSSHPGSYPGSLRYNGR